MTVIIETFSVQDVHTLYFQKKHLLIFLGKFYTQHIILAL